MRLLLDTQILLLASLDANLLPSAAFSLMSDPRNLLLFSAVSIWEVAIKSASSQHPMVLSCWKNDFDQQPGMVKEGEGAEESWVLYTSIGEHKLGIIVVGQHIEG